ncbi:MAG: hypothetical protein KDC46_09520 [Thermoleophilia bacterium]|nr:hypothetical protein [Thermoleophilia bacterium]
MAGIGAVGGASGGLGSVGGSTSANAMWLGTSSPSAASAGTPSGGNASVNTTFDIGAASQIDASPIGLGTPVFQYGDHKKDEQQPSAASMVAASYAAWSGQT